MPGTQTEFTLPPSASGIDASELDPEAIPISKTGVEESTATTTIAEDEEESDSEPSPLPTGLTSTLAARRESHTIREGAFKVGSGLTGLESVGGLRATSGLEDSTNLTSSSEKSLTGGEKDKEVAALKQFIDDDRHFSLVRNFRYADLVTLMNGVCGALSVFSSADYLITNNETSLWYALSLPLAGLFFDFFDGKVARWRNESSMLGQELDSLADSLSFGLAPALLGYVIGLRTNLDVVILSIFVNCGIARLARFNATVALIPKDPTGKSKYFQGLPIPTSLAIVGIMSYCVKNGWYIGGEHGDLPGGKIQLWEGAEVHLFSIVYACWSAAMVSKTLRIPKP